MVDSENLRYVFHPSPANNEPLHCVHRRLLLGAHSVSLGVHGCVRLCASQEGSLCRLGLICVAPLSAGCSLGCHAAQVLLQQPGYLLHKTAKKRGDNDTLIQVPGMKCVTDASGYIAYRCTLSTTRSVGFSAYCT